MIERLVQVILAGTVADVAMRDAIAGDLLEDYSLQSQSRGRLAAIAWIARQLAVSCPWFASLRSTRRTECLTARGALSFYGVMAFLLVLAVSMIAVVERFLVLPTSDAGAVACLVLSVGIATTFGYAGAYVARHVPLLGALSVGVIGLGAAIAASLLNEVHASPWSWGLLQGALIPATVAGGLLRARQTLERSLNAAH